MAVETYSYVPSATAFRDWLRTHPEITGLGTPPIGRRIFAATKFPRDAQLPAILFHRIPGGSFDWTVERARYQFECEAVNPGADSALGGSELVEQITSALAGVLMSTLSRTRLSPGSVFEGADVLDSFSLPDKNVPRQILLVDLFFASF